MESFLRYEFGGLLFGGPYTWRGLFSEFYGICRYQKLEDFLSRNIGYTYQCYKFKQ